MTMPKNRISCEYGVSVTFNVFDSSPFDVGDDEINSRSNSYEEAGDDQDISK